MPKTINDPIHGPIDLSDREVAVVDTTPFQRLRYIKQIGMGHFTFPNATHTRFAHSVGVLGIMLRATKAACDAGFLEKDSEDEEDLRLAALLHDIGHYPYSHVVEAVDSAARLTAGLADEETSIDLEQQPPYPSHVELGEIIVTSQQEIVDAIGSAERAQKVADIFTRSQAAAVRLSNFIDSSLDMDRVDYLLRDSHAAGVPYGHVDIGYVLKMLRASPQGVVGVDARALPAAEQVLMARYFMHRAVYYHKATVALEEACRQLIREVRHRPQYCFPANGDDVRALAKSDRLGDFTDASVDRIVQRAAGDDDEVVSALANCVRNRRPPRLLKEVCVLKKVDTSHHKASTFEFRCRKELPALAETKGIDLRRFLLWKAKPIRFEQRPRERAVGEALDPEQEEKVIRVFEPGKEEPTPVMNVPNSLIGECAGHQLHIVRLYIVPPAKDAAALVEELKGEVASWDSLES